MKIGTDMSIAECRRSGYIVMDFKKSDLIKKGKLDKDCIVNFTQSIPEAWNDAGKPLVGSEIPLYSTDEDLCFNNLLNFLNDNPKKREGIASFADWENCQPELENPTEYDFLHLASDINAYCGLDGI